MSAERSENLSKLALGAKLERALGRRMGGQDAVMKKKKKPTRSNIDAEKTLVPGQGEKVPVA